MQVLFCKNKKHREGGAFYPNIFLVNEERNHKGLCNDYSMRLLYKYRKTRSAWRRFVRLHFASPAELRFVELFGGRVWRVGWLRNPRTGFCFVYYNIGPFLKREFIEREVRVGPGVFVDFGAKTRYYKKAIEILGWQWHQDVLAEQSRHDYLTSMGWEVIYIEARQLWRDPESVKRKVSHFLSK